MNNEMRVKNFGNNYYGEVQNYINEHIIRLNC